MRGSAGDGRVGDWQSALPHDGCRESDNWSTAARRGAAEGEMKSNVNPDGRRSAGYPRQVMWSCDEPAPTWSPLARRLSHPVAVGSSAALVCQIAGRGNSLSSGAPRQAAQPITSVAPLPPVNITPCANTATCAHEPATLLSSISPQPARPACPISLRTLPAWIRRSRSRRHGGRRNIRARAPPLAR